MKKTIINLLLLALFFLSSIVLFIEIMTVGFIVVIIDELRRHKPTNYEKLILWFDMILKFIQRNWR